MNTFMCNMYKKNVWISCYFHVIKSAAFQTLMKSEKNLFLNMHFGFCSNRRCTGLQCRFLIQVSIALVMELLATWISTYTRIHETTHTQQVQGANFALHNWSAIIRAAPRAGQC